jgi:inosine-uridine nucleoside N-ribohydrolase
MSALPILLDVDTGVDDALAICLAVRSPEVALRGITTVAGNVDLESATRNTLAVLDVLRAPAIPVVSGAAAPLCRPLVTAAAVHGHDGLGGIARTLPASSRAAVTGAVEFLLQTIRASPEPLTLIATGPLTNVARALQADGAVLRRLRGLTIMGGAIRVPGNVSPVAEFNFAVDPEAAAIVLASGLPITLVPLDVTEQVILTRAAVAPRDGDGDLPTFVRAITAAPMDFQQAHDGVNGMYLHDPLAVATVLDPGLVRTTPLAVAVESRGVLTAGMAVADLRPGSRTPPTARVCLDVDAPRAFQLLSARLLGGRSADESFRRR